MRGTKDPTKKAEKIFDLMAEFAGYGFNKSHSCAYALLAYQTAYLKTHYPVEFMAALLTSETGNTEKVVKYINEARGMGITVLPPDVNSSDLDFTPVGEAIRFGLRAIKNVGENTVKGILEARAELGRFHVDLPVLRPHRHAPAEPARAGKPDQVRGHGFHRRATRAQMFAVIDRAMERAQRRQRERTSGQHGLFGGAAASRRAPAEEPLPDLEEWPEHEMLASEFATVWFLYFRPSAFQIRRQTCGIESRRSGRRGRPRERRRNHGGRNRGRDAQHAFAQGRPLGNSHAAGHDRGA